MGAAKWRGIEDRGWRMDGRDHLLFSTLYPLPTTQLIRVNPTKEIQFAALSRELCHAESGCVKKFALIRVKPRISSFGFKAESSLMKVNQGDPEIYNDLQPFTTFYKDLQPSFCSAQDSCLFVVKPSVFNVLWLRKIRVHL
jgi:hypothetical protein